MILVDTSVWIDFVRGTESWQALHLRDHLDSRPILIGDLVLVELLQGCRTAREFQEAQAIAEAVTPINIGGLDIAVQAARNYRTLRATGITIRSTIDTLIATRCIVDDLTLLHRDRDYDPFETTLGLRVVSQEMH